MAQKVLQAGLAAGTSAVTGFDSSGPKSLSHNYDGLNHVTPDSTIPQNSTSYSLRGKNGRDVEMPVISWVAWSWGDTSTSHWSDDELPALHAAWARILEQGMTFIDTAQVYGSGKSEEILGDLVNNHSLGIDRSKIIVQTKWLSNITDQATNIFYPVDAPVQALRKTLDRMKLTYVDCYLCHGPIHISSIKQVAEGLAKRVDEGMARAVGVANYSVRDMLKMKDVLAEYNVPLATNQCEYSILYRMHGTEGMLETRKKNDIIFQSYSSLGQGRLSGKYSKENPPPKEYRFSSYDMEYIEPLLTVLRKLARKHNVSVAAVAIDWNICNGAIPVFGIRKESQAVQNVQVSGWRWAREETNDLDKQGFEGNTTMLWQQG